MTEKPILLDLLLFIIQLLLLSLSQFNIYVQKKIKLVVTIKYQKKVKYSVLFQKKKEPGMLGNHIGTG